MKITFGTVILIIVIILVANYILHQSFLRIWSYRCHSTFDHCSKLINIIAIQNDTISMLESFARRESNKTFRISDRVTAINQVVALPQSLQPESPSRIIVQDAVDKTISSTDTKIESSVMSIKPTDMEFDCNIRYGLELVDEWRKSKETWCESTSNRDHSFLECYPYHQKHKKLDGRGHDMFCVAKNFVLDFSKIHGETFQHKPSIAQQYFRFDKGSIFSSCSKTSKYKPQSFMPHHSLQMSSFAQMALAYDSVVDEPMYLLARDEDCENSFHSTADFMNMFLVLSILQISPQDLKLTLFDNHPNGPYMELMKKAFSPRYAIHRLRDFANKKILFRQIIFHLESPAALIFPKVSRPDPMRCYSTSLFQAYRKFILNAFDLWNIPPPPIPTVTLSLRYRTEHKNVGRVLANEQEVISVINQGNLIKFQAIDGGSLSFSEHLKIIRQTNILVGVHGAGLMFIMFAAEEAILIEIHPSYRQDRHFRHAARMTGKIYMPMRASKRETCHGTSDNIFVQIDEFRTTLDGAVRIARSFDDGLSECGLVCPYEVLALDKKLNQYYSSKDKMVPPVNTIFPCG